MTYLFILAALFAQSTESETVTTPAGGTEETTTTEFTIFESVERSEYVLSAGDVLQMVVEGGTSQIMTLSGLASISPCQVSGDGMIQFSGVGQVYVKDLTIAEAERELQQLVSLYYPGTEVGLVLTQPRAVRVWITGMVDQPGQYTLYAINRVSDLVSEAGGLSSYSSRSGWMVTREGDSLEVDLTFDRLTGMTASDPFLQGGSVVTFSVLTDPVFVVRPGIRSYTDLYQVPEVETWECRDGESLENFMYRIGGISGEVDLSRSYLVSDGENIPVWTRGTGFSEQPVSPGDTLRLVVQGNDVYVSGAVNQRGIVAYIPGSRVRTYVERAGGVVSTGRIGGTTLTRNGVLIARGSEALEAEVLPGDVIDVPYGWVSRNYQTISILSIVVGMTSTIIYLTR